MVENQAAIVEHADWCRRSADAVRAPVPTCNVPAEMVVPPVYGVAARKRQHARAGLRQAADAADDAGRTSGAGRG